MAKYRHDLPQLADRTFLSDGGMETTLIFHEGVELPHFASFVLLATPEGRQQLKNYYERYLDDRRAARRRLRARHARPGAPTRTGEQGSATTPRRCKAINARSIELLSRTARASGRRRARPA